ncbi:Rieske (2Fe-2S) protein [Kitasatospora sp. NPDC057015]|uniref:Rieske (2Fe-2S) protein n=1 Tax=Kitasatospora sp. NPDC057015 TaxID=3346001 RepID=UPI00363AA950
MSEAQQSPATTRRTLLCGAAAVLAGGGALTVSGCSSAGGSTSSTAAAGGPVEVGPASEVPVGGGKVFREKKIVVTQPTAGQYKAFSAKCTHAGCIVDQVKNNEILCPCHGSRFSITDGSVQGTGPAPTPLPSYQVTEKDGTLTVTQA